MAWDIGDPVQVKVGNSWLNATVMALPSPGSYCVEITTDPLPLMSDLGLTHPRVNPATTRIMAGSCVSSAPNSMDTPGNYAHSRIRTPI